jgi:hypothetical protein
MGTATKNLNLWQRQYRLTVVKQELPKGHINRSRRRVGDRHRYRDQGVGAEPAPVLGTIEVDQDLVKACLTIYVQAFEGRCNLGVYIFQRPSHIVAAKDFTTIS